MVRIAIGIFLILHGLTHAVLYNVTAEPRRGQPFDPRRSRLLTASRMTGYQAERLSVALATFVAAIYVLSGLILLLGATWWIPFAGAAAILGLALKLLYFHTWLLFGILVDALMLVAVATGWFEQALA